MKNGDMTFGNSHTSLANSQTSSFAKAMRALQETLRTIRLEKSELEIGLLKLRDDSEQYEFLTEQKLSGLTNE